MSLKFYLFTKYVQFIDCLQKEATIYCCPLHTQLQCANLSARCRSSSSVISDLALLSRVSLAQPAAILNPNRSHYTRSKLELCRGAGRENRGLKMTAKPVKSTAASQIKTSDHKLFV